MEYPGEMGRACSNKEYKQASARWCESIALQDGGAHEAGRVSIFLQARDKDATVDGLSVK